MEPTPVGVRLPPGPPRPPAPPTAGGWSNASSPGGRPADRRLNFFHGVSTEVRKISWPTRSGVFHNAAILLGALTLLIAAIGGVDAGSATVMRLVNLGG